MREVKWLLCATPYYSNDPDAEQVFKMTAEAATGGDMMSSSLM